MPAVATAEPGQNQGPGASAAASRDLLNVGIFAGRSMGLLLLQEKHGVSSPTILLQVWTRPGCAEKAVQQLFLHMLAGKNLGVQGKSVGDPPVSTWVPSG